MPRELTYKGPVEFSIEIALEKIEGLLKEGYSISKRTLGLLILSEDQEVVEHVRTKQPEIIPQIEEILKEVKVHEIHPIEYEVALEQREEAARIASRVIRIKEGKISFRESLDRLTMNPITGIPILLIVLYWGLYKFVGEIGAGVAVDFIEGTVFKDYINPYLIAFFTNIIPWQALQELFIGEYGLITLGIRYAIGIILPIVTFFFLIFAIIEDSGYLPRLAMLIDRTFKKIGLSGRAVIPMVLGLGCDTMATMVTRTLPTKRERLISTILLALAVPCSAQLGVILAIFEGRPFAMFAWALIIGIVFLFIGYLSALVLPGERPSFYMEVPPLRFPKISNVLTKTYVRIRWYFWEVIPIFLIASFIIWFGDLIRVFSWIIGLLEKPVMLIGLPPETAKVFFFGFFRRDYGAAGLYDLNKEALLTGNQLLVACVALTLFLPCIAQFLMTVKERGWKVGFGISAFVLVFAFTVAYFLNLVLNSIGVVF